MTMNQAAKEARRRWGVDALVTFNNAALTKEEKEPHYEIIRRRKEEGSGVTKAQVAKAQGMVLGMRCSVGVYMSVGGTAFNSIKGQGDTWEEAFANADKNGGGSSGHQKEVS